MSAAFTKGPWVVRKSETALDICLPLQPGASGVAVIATVFGGEADASLIKAAPDLYAIADEFLSSLEMLERHGPHMTCADGEFISSSVLLDRADKLRTALSKARGDSSIATLGATGGDADPAFVATPPSPVSRSRPAGFNRGER